MSVYTEERQALHAYLSKRSHDILQEFGELNGASATALVEALCIDLGEEMERDGPHVRQDWVVKARAIDALRRRRG